MQGSSGGAVSGLIVDARGLGLRPAMAPKVLDQNGQEVYGSKFVSREYAVDIGMVAMKRRQPRLQKRTRGEHAAHHQGHSGFAQQNRRRDQRHGCPKIQSTAVNTNFLQHCKVMFILD